MKLFALFAYLFATLFSYQLVATEKFVVFAPPKCGTHLIGKGLELLLEKNAQYHLGALSDEVNLANSTTNAGGFVVSHHWSYEGLKKLISQGYKVIFIIRDPRDQIISIQDWIREGQWSWLPAASIASVDEQLTKLISGNILNECLFSKYKMLHSLPKHSYYVVRYENLVGMKGGGSDEAQFQELAGLANFLSHAISSEDTDRVLANLFGSKGTFRIGRIGRWKERFKPVHKYQFKLIYGKHLTEMGY